MKQEQYEQELAKIVMLFSHDVVDIVQERMKTYTRENFVCKVCGCRE